MSKNADQIERSEKISFQFDGNEVDAFAGESISAALLRAGISHIRNAPNSATPRGMFCVMGACQECVVSIDGEIVEACRTDVVDGLIVQRVSYV